MFETVTGWMTVLLHIYWRLQAMWEGSSSDKEDVYAFSLSDLFVGKINQQVDNCFLCFVAD
jgi:hypothetical protein